MNKQARLDEIVTLLQGNVSLRVNDLASALNVSKETLRRDLKYLQLKGLLIREYGKAKSLKRIADDPSVAFQAFGLAIFADQQAFQLQIFQIPPQRFFTDVQCAGEVVHPQ